MINRSHDVRCERCGAVVSEREIHGQDAESCICMIRYADERMPDVWHRVSRRAMPTAD
jgi:hypothetical protein